MTRVALAIGIAIVFPIAVHAQEPPRSTVTHRVRKDDTLALLAAEFYGDRNKQIFIMVENKMQHPRPLKPGERLRIPMNREITTKPGDTFDALAATYLGDVERAVFLAEINGLSATDSLAAGRSLNVPLMVTHVPANPETLQQISLAYFGEPSQADMLRRFNSLDKNQLDKGESLLIPVYNVRGPASKLPPIDADSKARRAKRTEIAQRAAIAIPAARHAWRVGEYAAVKSLLAEIDVDYLDTQQAAEVGLLLASVHVAYDDTDLALAAFKRVRDRKPQLKLRSYDFSAKVLQVWARAGGQSE